MSAKLRTDEEMSMRGVAMTLGAVAVLALGAMAAGCGSKQPVCGNGAQEEGEQCDRGADNGRAGIACNADCKAVSVLIPQLNISWALLKNLEPPIPGWGGASCSDFGATKAQIKVDGPSPIKDRIFPCTQYSFLYSGVCPMGNDGGSNDCARLQPGSYQVTVTLLRDDGTAVTSAVSTPRQEVQPGQAVAFNIYYQPADFLQQSWSGSLDFKVSWGQRGQYCDKATPPVTQESILLYRDGQAKPVMGMTKGGTKLDGTPGKCAQPDPITGSGERIENLPWGRYRLVVFSPNRAYCGATPVFVAPGKTPMTWDLLVPLATPLPDGGVTDGGVGDGGVGGCP